MVPWARKWAVACRFGELSQQPTWPHCMHMPQVHPLAADPQAVLAAVLDGATSATTVSRCRQVSATVVSPVDVAGPLAESRVEHVDERIELILGQKVEEWPQNGLTTSRGGGLDGAPPHRCDARQQGATVVHEH